jgi:hypothetical protein
VPLRAEVWRATKFTLRNNGDGHFTDVTIETGLLSFHPTRLATWNDLKNDGWLDVFIGNESTKLEGEPQHPCELYINKGDGTFIESAVDAKCNIVSYIKELRRATTITMVGRIFLSQRCRAKYFL